MLNRLYLADGQGRFHLDVAGEAATHAEPRLPSRPPTTTWTGMWTCSWPTGGSPGSHNRLYRNTSSGRSWLKVKLEGVRSNRMGLGSQVSVLVSSHGRARWLHRWLDAATGYAGQNEPVLHFGLGTAAAVDSLVVRWPSGLVDRFGDVAARKTVSIREGSR